MLMSMSMPLMRHVLGLPCVYVHIIIVMDTSILMATSFHMQHYLSFVCRVSPLFTHVVVAYFNESWSYLHMQKKHLHVRPFFVCVCSRTGDTVVCISVATLLWATDDP